MRPPGAITALIGHPAVALPIFLGAVAVGYYWLAGELTGWAAFGAVVLATWTAKASDQVNKYRAFKREWDAMSGGSVARRTLRIGGLRYVFGIAAWLFMALLAIDASSDPAIAWVGWLFWLVSGLAVLSLIATPRRRGKRGSTVAVLVKIGDSPSVAEAANSLPGYCRTLISLPSRSN